jgi:hypothetical protein
MKRSVHFLLILSILLLYYGVSGLLNEFTRSESDLTDKEGRIVALHEKNPGKGAAVHPIVTFTDETGNEITFTSHSGSYFYKNRVGKTVKVVYPLGFPESVWIKSSLSKDISPVVSLLSGTVLFVLWFAEAYKNFR